MAKSITLFKMETYIWSILHIVLVSISYDDEVLNYLLCLMYIWNRRVALHLVLKSQQGHSNCGGTPQSNFRWVFKLLLCLYIFPHWWHLKYGGLSEIKKVLATTSSCSNKVTLKTNTYLRHMMTVNRRLRHMQPI